MDLREIPPPEGLAGLQQSLPAPGEETAQVCEPALPEALFCAEEQPLPVRRRGRPGRRGPEAGPLSEEPPAQSALTLPHPAGVRTLCPRLTSLSAGSCPGEKQPTAPEVTGTPRCLTPPAWSQASIPALTSYLPWGQLPSGFPKPTDAELMTDSTECPLPCSGSAEDREETHWRARRQPAAEEWVSSPLATMVVLPLVNCSCAYAFLRAGL